MEWGLVAYGSNSRNGNGYLKYQLPGGGLNSEPDAYCRAEAAAL